MTFQMKPLPYAQDALEPHLSKEVIHFHYDKRTKKYYDVANDLVKGTIYENIDLEKLLTKESLAKIDSKLFIHASQAWNHTFYWDSMAPKSETGKMSADLESMMVESFGSVAQFEKQFKEKVNAVVGSGWTWLLYRNNSLSIKNIPNAGSPLTEGGTVVPLLTCDAWEHAFELQYPADKKAYVESFMDVINWNKVNERFKNGNK